MKIDKADFRKFEQSVDQYQDEIALKLKYISVFQQELAKALLPDKESGKFNSSLELQTSIKNKE